VITDVTIVDPSGARQFPRPVTVMLDAGHIVTVSPTLPSSARRGAQVIAGRRWFLIPGLWDMHVHVVDAGERALGEAVAAGVTGIRDRAANCPSSMPGAARSQPASESDR
jgi:imidazolonepropionase-like amidohydrolase